jgi:lipopolysaccharide export system protein LptA
MKGFQRLRGVLLGVLLLCGPAAAQNLDLRGGVQDVVIEAENGIEWHQGDRMFIARGKAKAQRGEVTVFADMLRAYYREKPDGGTDIWRLDAEGHVRIESPGEKASGDLAVYEVDKSVLVLTGKNGVRFQAGNDVVTAKKQLEYWDQKEMAVARGSAHALRDDKNLWADVLVAHFRKDKAGRSEVYRIEAFDSVRIQTPQDRVDADRGVYNVKTGIATVSGRVKIQRDKNVLNGCRAEVNLNTNISRLFGCEGGGAARVSGTLQPEKVQRNVETK